MIGPRYCLYRAFNSEGALLYIGRSGRVEHRIREHEKYTPWATEVARWDVTECSDWWDALHSERDAIETESPLYNVMFNTSRGTAA